MTLRYSIIAVALAACIGTAGASAATLPAPDGEYAVGMVRAEFTDPARTLDAGTPDSGTRRLPAVVWYPAAAQASAASAPYLEQSVAATTLPAITRNFRYADGDLHAVAAARIAVHPGARPAKAKRGFPVVVYSHGLFLYPEQNSMLAARLASHGYIVVSIAHPGDSTDVRLQDGTLVATQFGGTPDDPRFNEAWKAIAGGADLAVRRDALATYADAFPATRIGRSFAAWRDDTIAVADAIVARKEPAALKKILATADRTRLAFAGMSFGGATSATTCHRVAVCRAAINLDGQNFDPALFNGAVGRPLLLMLSDWPRYGLLEGQPREADFSPNDLAYEPWASTGKNEDVVRVRLEGIRHLGFTDLVTLLDGPKRQERVGDIDGNDALATIDDVVLAFLNAYVRGGDAADIQRAIDRHPALKRHVPTRMQRWASESAATP
jgi:predicted dienelactone hydrolase